MDPTALGREPPVRACGTDVGFSCSPPESGRSGFGRGRVKTLMPANVEQCAATTYRAREHERFGSTVPRVTLLLVAVTVRCFHAGSANTGRHRAWLIRGELITRARWRS